MHPRKPNAGQLPTQPKGFFAKQLEKKQGQVNKEVKSFDKDAPFLISVLPDAVPPEPKIEDSMNDYQKHLANVIRQASDFAMVQTLFSFLGRVPEESEIAQRGLFAAADKLDPDGYEVSEFRFDGKTLFTRKIGFKDGEFVFRIKLHV